MHHVKTSTSEQGQQGGRGHLERAVLEVLWDHPEGVTALQVMADLEGREVAVTTVLTVLERLRAKGQVTRWRVGRSYRHRASATREQATAAVMLAALGQAANRSATLARLVADAGAEDLAALRQALLAPAGDLVAPVCGPGHARATTVRAAGPTPAGASGTATGCGGASGLCGCCTCEPGCACCAPLAAAG